MTETVKISLVKPNPNNPRIIKDDKFIKLVNSIKEFPKMLELRPIVVNDDMVVLGGNMRLKACKEAGLKEVPIIKASQLTEDEQKEFIIKDNASFGDWDDEDLKTNWDENQLKEWGLDVNFSDDNETSKKEVKELKPYVKTHILISFNPQDILKLKPFLDSILEIEGIEYEQSSN